MATVSPGDLYLLTWTCIWGTDRLRNLSRNANFFLVVQVEAFVHNLIGVLVEGSVVVVVILTGKTTHIFLTLIIHLYH